MGTGRISVSKVIIQSGQPVYKQVRLPQPGTVLVRTGQEVEVGDVLAEAVIPREFQVFDIVNHLRDPAKPAGAVSQAAEW